MNHAMIHCPTLKRTACSVCRLDTFRHKGWFLVVENRWLDRLKILSWHAALAGQIGMKSVCSREHLKALIAHWLTQASLRLPPMRYEPMPISSDPTLTDVELGPDAVGRVVGELAVPLEYILDALITIGAENIPHALECQIYNLPHGSSHGMSLQ
jgi:hypothetical protein